MPRTKILQLISFGKTSEATTRRKLCPKSLLFSCFRTFALGYDQLEPKRTYRNLCTYFCKGSVAVLCVEDISRREIFEKRYHPDWNYCSKCWLVGEGSNMILNSAEARKNEKTRCCIISCRRLTFHAILDSFSCEKNYFLEEICEHRWIRGVWVLPIGRIVLFVCTSTGSWKLYVFGIVE